MIHEWGQALCLVFPNLGVILYAHVYSYGLCAVQCMWLPGCTPHMHVCNYDYLRVNDVEIVSIIALLNDMFTRVHLYTHTHTEKNNTQ